MTLKRFGTSTINTTNGPVLDEEWFVDFDQFGPTITVEASVVLQSEVANAPATIALYATAVEGDITETGALLATITAPPAGTGGLMVGLNVSFDVPNPGGQKYIAVVSREGI